MSVSWYYVEGSDRRGPIEQHELEIKLKNGELGEVSYVWRKGFDNWKKVIEVEELKPLLRADESGKPTASPRRQIDWENLPTDEMVFTIKVGHDRQDGGRAAEYGPYSIELLQRLFKENRINGKTLVFVPGMENWAFLADLPIYEKAFSETPPIIGDAERRPNVRRPFVARMLFHDNSFVFEGICRDITIGGLQVLVSNFPGEVGDEISINVHPDNSEYSFAATGRVVRILEGNQGFSLRFVELSNEALNAIRAYIEQPE